MATERYKSKTVNIIQDSWSTINTATTGAWVAVRTLNYTPTWNSSTIKCIFFWTDGVIGASTNAIGGYRITDGTNNSEGYHGSGAIATVYTMGQVEILRNNTNGTAFTVTAYINTGSGGTSSNNINYSQVATRPSYIRIEEYKN